MNELFGTNSAIEEAGYTMRKFGFLKISICFLLIYYISSLLSGIILSGPTLYYVFSSDSIIELLKSGESDQVVITEALNDTIADLPDWLNAMSLFSTVSFIIVTTFFCVKIEKRSLFSMGFCKNGAFKEYFVGLVIGTVMFCLVYAALYAFGQAGIAVNFDLSIGTIVLFLIGFVVQGMGEEVLLRGFYFVSAANGSSVGISVFTSATLFALLHINNSGIGIMPLLNLFLFGVFAALYFLRRGSIWGISAIHTMWNFMQGNVFGFRVSGNAIGSSIFHTETNGNMLISGGEFGPEGGISVTVVLFIGIVILLIMHNRVIMPEVGRKEEFYSA